MFSSIKKIPAAKQIIKAIKLYPDVINVNPPNYFVKNYTIKYINDFIINQYMLSIQSIFSLTLITVFELNELKKIRFYSKLI